MKKNLLIGLLFWFLICLHGCTEERIIEPEPDSTFTIERLPGEMWAQREYRDGNDRIIFEWLQMESNGSIWLHWIEPAGEWVPIELDKIGNSHWFRFAEDEKKRPATEEEIEANP